MYYVSLYHFFILRTQSWKLVRIYLHQYFIDNSNSCANTDVYGCKQDWQTAKINRKYRTCTCSQILKSMNSQSKNANMCFPKTNKFCAHENTWLHSKVLQHVLRHMLIIQTETLSPWHCSKSFSITGHIQT